MGNHEHYKGTFNKSANLLREGLSEYKNLHFLDNDSVTIDGVLFVGSTLWANVNVHCPLTCNKLQFAMNDFRIIKYCDSKGNYRKFSVNDMYREHKISSMYLENTLPKDKPCVVITHHAPSFRSIHPEYANDTDLNTLYASDMEYLMTDNVKLWIHGHTHSAFDYNIGKTRVICNPRGYPGENKNVNLELVLEIVNG
jgi:Icc-related predicted phosphoesterase